MEQLTFKHTIPIQLRFNDFDALGHVNNSVYLKWAINSLEFNFLENNRMLEVDILYKKEVLLGDTVTVKSKLIENNMNQMIYNSNGDILTKIESKWAPRGD